MADLFLKKMKYDAIKCHAETLSLQEKEILKMKGR